MTWCKNGSNQESLSRLQMLSAQPSQEKTSALNSKLNEIRTIACPSCGHPLQVQDQAGILQDLPGLPDGVKFDPSDQEILEHLQAKIQLDSRKIHPLIDEFIRTIHGENGICYTHPEKLPGVNKDGQIRHFFHRPSKAYTTGTRKRRKVHTDTEADGGGETRWHKTGKTRPVFTGGDLKGYKKILVLYTNYGRQKKPEKTNWVMHQYHLGHNEEEKDGELVVSKVFYQTQPRQCGSSSTSSIKEFDFQQEFDPPIDKGSGSLSHGHLIKSTSNIIEYYNAPPLLLSPYNISYNVGSQSRDSPTQVINPNLVVHGDGSSFIQLPSSASKVT
ncbi:hypothetical protein ACH5RR_017971 [Cinchona calisaya]|uniref:NAC domain-containing protein n=1 Tax=Cinchona calisaya TaxID=153742 RepID=A0ABD2ZK37_9GENT